MDNTIVVNVDELFNQIKEMKNDGMKYVELLILEAENFENDIIPKTLSLSASESFPIYSSVDYEMIEEVQD